jgi:hypothetical protein
LTVDPGAFSPACSDHDLKPCIPVSFNRYRVWPAAGAAK